MLMKKLILKELSNKQMELIKLNSLMHSKGNHKQNEKTTHRMGENICKWSDQQELISKTDKQLVRHNDNNKK